MIKVIKYTQLTQQPNVIAYQNDRAMADFRGFLELGSVHVERVNDLKAIDVMEEILDGLKNALRTRRKVISSK